MPPSSTELPTDWASRPGFSLTQADIEEFKAIIRSEYGVELADQEAWNRVIELLNLYRNLLGPIPEDPGALRPTHASVSLTQMAKPPQLLLLTGIPGTGKTSTGEHLAHNHGFVHLEAEVFAASQPVSNWQEWEALWLEFVARADALRKAGKSVVITWGFMPGVDDKTIRHLQAMGFTMVWFDGDRTAARREFLRRGTVPEQLLDVQMNRIATLDLDSFSPIRFDPFDRKGTFLSRKAIAERMLALPSA